MPDTWIEGVGRLARGGLEGPLRKTNETQSRGLQCDGRIWHFRDFSEEELLQIKLSVSPVYTLRGLENEGSSVTGLKLDRF